MNKHLPLLLILGACGPTEKPPTSAPLGEAIGVPGEDPAAAPRVEETTLAAVGLDPSALDREADPCDDFYQFACGGWAEATEIPADKSRYGRFTEIHERNEAELRKILDAALEAESPAPLEAKLGAYYGACMDEAAIEKTGLAAIKPLLARARKLRNRADVDALTRELHHRGIWPLFSLESSPDFADATQMIAFVNQGGLGLPDRDYYLSDDEKFVALRDAYQKHVARMLALAGKSKAAARRAAADVLEIETELAKASKTRVERRDPKGVYNPVDLAGLEKLAPTFDWKAYFAELGNPDISKLSVEAPAFLERVEALRSEVKPRAWRSYFEWRILDSTASTLPKRFVDESFSMQKALSGAEELPPRWKRCIAATDGALGELLAQPYLERMFTPDAKAAADELVSGIVAAMGDVLDDADWMSDETRAKARTKLTKMVPLIGYPERWKEYDFSVDPKSYSANALAASTWEVERDVAKVGKPYDRSEWYMSPQTTNAYYNPLANQMVFPAGILQKPFFSAEAHAPANFGAIGMVMGHELTHGFDDQGSQFDAEGNMVNWWQPDDQKEFSARGECVVAQYGEYEPVEGVHLNGKLTLGENIADIGGIKLAYLAYRKARADADVTYVADGFSEDQQFFLSVGQAWCSKAREEETRRRVVTDPHSPPRYRVLGSLRNTPAFSQAFACEAPAEVCEVW